MSAHTTPDALSLQGSFGRYQVRRLLARGATTAAYLVHDPVSGRDVVLKVPLLQPHDRPDEALARFQDSARAVTRLNHPNVCPVFDAGSHAGLPYIVTAYVNGMTLAEYLRGRVMSPERAARLVRQVAAALQQAHAAGVVHRDVRSSNVLLDSKGNPYLIDFGLARRFDDPPGPVRTRPVTGSPAYVAPEQVRGEVREPSPAGDVYGLGVVFYEALTGRLPFGDGPATAVLVRLLKEQPVPPSMLRPEVPVGFDEVCLRAMAKDPALRYPGMESLIGDLDAHLAAPAPAALGTLSPAAPPPAAQTYTELGGNFELEVEDGPADPLAATAVPQHTVLAVPLDPDPPPAPAWHPAPAPPPAPQPEPQRPGGGAGWFVVKLLLLLALLGGAAFAGSVFWPQGDLHRQIRTAFSYYPPEAPAAPPAAPSKGLPAADPALAELQAKLADRDKEVEESKTANKTLEERLAGLSGKLLSEEAQRRLAEDERRRAERERGEALGKQRLAENEARAARAARTTAENQAAAERGRAELLRADLNALQGRIDSVEERFRARRGWVLLSNPTGFDIAYETRHMKWDGTWVNWQANRIEARKVYKHWYRGPVLVQVRFDNVPNDGKFTWKVYDLPCELHPNDGNLKDAEIRCRYAFATVNNNTEIELRRTDFPN